MKKISLFSVDNSLNKYTYPIVKIVICLSIILLLIFRNHFIPIEQLIWKIIEGVFCVILGLACILCIYISVAEMIIVSDNQSENYKNITEQTEECRWFSVDKVVSLASQNDIIEYEILSNGASIKIGASSDYKPADSVFFDKLYYIGNSEYDDIESFEEELQKYSVDGQILIVAIDGVSPECYQ